jgi:hypothetical protein
MAHRDLNPRNAFAEEHDVRFHHAAAGRAMRHGEAREVHVVEFSVAIRQSDGIQVGPACVETD